MNKYFLVLAVLISSPGFVCAMEDDEPVVVVEISSDDISGYQSDSDRAGNVASAVFAPIVAGLVFFKKQLSSAGNFACNCSKTACGYVKSVPCNIFYFIKDGICYTYHYCQANPRNAIFIGVATGAITYAAYKVIKKIQEQKKIKRALEEHYANQK